MDVLRQFQGFSNSFSFLVDAHIHEEFVSTMTGVLRSQDIFRNTLKTEIQQNWIDGKISTLP
jgi:hypothetical protein